ncbi:MAG: 1-deoxy-D-xylulose-5-phosphate reductoisomerase [Rhodospirillaceae bacterium]|nr:1-deoxy-D-xylulose-5-phosphate reductoisomerase [Rhodospirillaceae bacterium]
MDKVTAELRSESAAAMEPRTVTVLGSTGSVGCNTIDLIERNPDLYAVEALTANSNVALLAEQARRLKPRLAVVADERGYAELKTSLAGTGVQVAAGADAVIEAAERPADWVMAAIVGAAGLRPTLAAVRRGAVVALANKECLVSAGGLMMREVAAAGATLLPVDSEHSAIFQLFDFEHRQAIEKIILTASGGPFRQRSLAEMEHVTPAEAIRHPNWSMGAKISIDSATMMNKGLELIEAYHLFDLPVERIEILVHPQSVVHSLVAYIDGSVLAHLGTPDMRTPIAYALGWPRRIAAPSARLDLAQLGQLSFEPPDFERFPSLRLARDALMAGGSAPTVLNAANEVAVQAFLDGAIGFTEIARTVENVLDKTNIGAVDSLEDIAMADAAARAMAVRLI